MTDRWGWLSPSCHESVASGGSAVVEENNDEGRAEVTFTAPLGWKLEKLSLERCAFAWLDEPLCADGIVLAQSIAGDWHAHVVECKRTVTDEKWQRVQRQLRGSCLRLLAVGGVLGLEIDKITLYTAFRRTKISARTPDFALMTPPPGRVDPRERFAQRLAWQAPRLPLEGFGMLDHQRIQLDDRGDDVGRATVSLGATP